jgi:hypothetical protein
MKGNLKATVEQLRDTANNIIIENISDKILNDFVQADLLKEEMLEDLHTFSTECVYLTCACSILFSEDLKEIINIIKVIEYKLIINEISWDNMIEEFIKDYFDKVYQYKPQTYFYEYVEEVCVRNLTEIVEILGDVYDQVEDKVDVNR